MSIHDELKADITIALENFFPSAGIAVAGSVQRGTYTSNSDIDFLVLDNSFTQNLQYVTFLKNIRINIVCLNPQNLERQFELWPYQFNSQQINFINGAGIIRDPMRLITNLQARTLNIVQRQRESDPMLLEQLRNRINEAMNKMQGKNFHDNSISPVILINQMVSTWFIQHGIALVSKEQHRRSFEIIKEQDFAFYNLLKCCFPINQIGLEHIYAMERHLFKEKEEVETYPTKVYS